MPDTPEWRLTVAKFAQLMQDVHRFMHHQVAEAYPDEYPTLALRDTWEVAEWSRIAKQDLVGFSQLSPY